jgi:hypothetical protein
MGSTSEFGNKPVPENQGNKESNSILPSYLSGSYREAGSRWLRPNKELLNGWDSVAEYAFDVANIIRKPYMPSIPMEDVEARQDEEWGMHMPADTWEELTVANLEGDEFGHLIPQFKQDMQEYRKAVKATVQLWRENGLL